LKNPPQETRSKEKIGDGRVQMYAPRSQASFASWGYDASTSGANHIWKLTILAVVRSFILVSVADAASIANNKSCLFVMFEGSLRGYNC
jgi:hypothetical protein